MEIEDVLFDWVIGKSLELISDGLFSSYKEAKAVINKTNEEIDIVWKF